MKNLWWGYLHENGTIQVKRYFEPLDIQEALESPFVQWAAGPWPCLDREAALSKMRKLIR